MKEGVKVGEEYMTLEEQKQVAIDYYINLMRIKEAEQAGNKELDRQIAIAKLKLSTFAVDLDSVNMIFEKK